jgi:very-short-patch-repair endonuclease
MNAPIVGARGPIGLADVAFRRARLIISLDTCSSDQGSGRPNQWVAEGWAVLRFTWRELNEHPAAVLDAIASSLARRDPSGLAR